RASTIGGGGPTRTYTRPRGGAHAMVAARSTLTVAVPISFLTMTRSPASVRQGAGRAGLKPAHGVLDRFGQLLVVVAFELDRAPERDARAARPRHAPAGVQHPIETVDPHGDDRHVEPRGDHADAGTEPSDLAVLAPLTFRKDQDR